MSFEKTIAEAIEPVIDAVIDLEKKVGALKLQHGVDGKDGKDGRDGIDGADGKSVDKEAVAALVVKDYADLIRGKDGADGKDGIDGKDGTSVDLADVIDGVVSKYGTHLRGKDGLDGQDGRDGKDGLDGKNGKDAPPINKLAIVEAVVTEYAEILTGKDGRDGVDGKDGASVEPEQVVSLLKSSEDFLAATKGDPGQDGAPGPAGRDGSDGKDGGSVVLGDVVEKLVAEHAAALRGQDGADGRDGKDGRDGIDGVSPDVETVAKILAETYEVTRGADGKDGAGIHTPLYVKGGVYREGTVVTAFLGQHFLAKYDTYEEPGAGKDWERIGTWGFRHRGTFEKDASYQEGDIFIKDFGSFVIIDGEPTILAGRGAKGEKGSVGATGREGKDGAAIIGGEVKGFKMVFVQQDPEGNIDHIEMDFTPAIKAQFAAMEEGLVEAIPGLTKGFVDEMYVHDKDPEAIPIKFFRGLWHVDIPFKRGDCFVYANALYVAKQDGKGVIPRGYAEDDWQSRETWQPIATWAAPNYSTGGGGSGAGGASWFSQAATYQPDDTIFFNDTERASFVSMYRNSSGGIILPGVFDPAKWQRLGSYSQTPWTLDRATVGQMEGGALSFVAGSSNVDVAAGRGVFLVPDKLNGTGSVVEWVATSVPLPNLAIDSVYYIVVNDVGVVSALPALTNDLYQLLRTFIVLGIVQQDPAIPLTIGAVSSWPIGSNETAKNVAEYLSIFTKPQFIGGGAISARGGATPMEIARATGAVYAVGINAAANPGSPNIRSLNGASPVSIQYLTANGTPAGAVRNPVDNTHYDLNDVVTVIPADANATIQRMFYDLVGNRTYVVYGNKFFATFAEAVQQLSNDDLSFVAPDYLTVGTLFIGYIITSKACVSLTDVASALIKNATGSELKGGASAVETLDGLTDVVINLPLRGQVLAYTGAEWQNQDNASLQGVVTQVAHGFAIGDVVSRAAGGNWVLARANNADTLAVGFVGELITPDTFLLVYAGRMRHTAHGYPPGAALYLSETSAGDVRTTRVADGINYNQSLGQSIDANYILITVSPGAIISISSGIRQWVAGENWTVGEYVEWNETFWRMIQDVVNSPAVPNPATMFQPLIHALANGSDTNAMGKTHQLALGFNGTLDRAHYIRSRHDANVAEAGVEFLTSDGTLNSPLATAVPAFHLRNARPHSGEWGGAYRKPLSELELPSRGYHDRNNFKQPCRCASTATLNAAYNNGASGVGSTLTAAANAALVLDGVGVAIGDRVLIKDQATQTHNGIYDVIESGSAILRWVLRRSEDADEPFLLSCSMVSVQNGATNGGRTYYTTFLATNNIGVQNIVWNDPIHRAFETRIHQGQNVPNGVTVNVGWGNNVLLADAGIWDFAQPSVFNIPETGVWLFTASVTWSNLGAWNVGVRKMWFLDTTTGARWGETTYYAPMGEPSNAHRVKVTTSGSHYMTAGTQVFVQIWQNSGGDLALGPQVGNNDHISIVRVF